MMNHPQIFIVFFPNSSIVPSNSHPSYQSLCFPYFPNPLNACNTVLTSVFSSMVSHPSSPWEKVSKIVPLHHTNVISIPFTTSDGICITSCEAGNPALKSHFRFCLLEASWYQLSRSGFLGNRLWRGDLLSGILLGSSLRNTPQREWGNKIGQRKKLICDVVTTEVPASPIGSSGIKMVLQSCPKLKQEGQDLLP